MEIKRLKTKLASPGQKKAAQSNSANGGEPLRRFQNYLTSAKELEIAGAKGSASKNNSSKSRLIDASASIIAAVKTSAMPTSPKAKTPVSRSQELFKNPKATETVDGSSKTRLKNYKWQLKAILSQNVLEKVTRPVRKVTLNNSTQQESRLASARQSPDLRKSPSDTVKLYQKQFRAPSGKRSEEDGEKPRKAELLINCRKRNGSSETLSVASTVGRNKENHGTTQNIYTGHKLQPGKITQLRCSTKACDSPANGSGQSFFCQLSSSKAMRTMGNFKSGAQGLFRPAFRSKVDFNLLIHYYSIRLQTYDGFQTSVPSFAFYMDQYAETTQGQLISKFGEFFNQDHPGASAVAHSMRLEQFVVFLILGMVKRYSNVSRLQMLYELVCFNLYCFFIIILTHLKETGLQEQHRRLSDFLKENDFVLVFKTPNDPLTRLLINNKEIEAMARELVEGLDQESEVAEMKKILKLAESAPLVSFAATAHGFLHERSRNILSSESLVSISASKKVKESRTTSEASLYCDEEDPLFILQPLKVECFLPAQTPRTKPLTLVLDLDETLVHFYEGPEGDQFLIRPYAQEFLASMRHSFEIVIFTAALKDYADWILDRFDRTGAISYRLYRNHTIMQNGYYLKDLSKLGRDIKKVLIVDNSMENFQLQPENGIYIRSWYGDPHDVALKQLGKVLTDIAEETTDDVRVTLRSFHDRHARRNPN